MRSVLAALASLVVGALLVSCQRPTSAGTLRADAALHCQGGPSLLVTRPAEGQFRLGAVVLDSAHLVAAIPRILGPRPNKVVLVDVSVDQSRAPLWLINAIRDAGGDAYRPDSNCLLPSFASRIAYSTLTTSPPTR